MTDQTTDIDTLEADVMTRRPPDSVADALRRIVAGQALAGWLNDLEGDLRDWLQDRADTVREQEGVPANWPLVGIARAYETDPQPKPRVSDHRTFAAWLYEMRGDDSPTAEVVDVEASDGSRAADALDRIGGWLADHAADPADADDLHQFVDHVADLTEELSVTRYRVPSEDALDGLLEDGDAALHEQDDGGWQLIDPETGETIPGTKVTQATPTLTIRPDSDGRDAIRAELDDLLGPAALDY